MKLLCRIFGHKWTIKGITGEYEWCKRCANRRRQKPAEIIRLRA